MQGLQAEVQNLKDQVQELHRDLTKHHSLIRAEIMADILHRSLRLDAQIDSEYASVEAMRAVFQEVALPRGPGDTGRGRRGPWPPEPRGPAWGCRVALGLKP